MKISKKSILSTSLAVALAAATIGGSYAYLHDSTEDVVNNFATNQVTVSLAETTGDDYNIIPGTEQTKDPKVTVNTTVPAYVYVDVNLTSEVSWTLIDYEIADGWTLLEKFSTEKKKVYFREVIASDNAQEFYVLKDNKVSYAADIENKDMTYLGAGKKMINPLKLTFMATAVQKEPFNNPENAYKVELPADENTFETAVKNGAKNIIVQDDIDFKSVTKMSGKGTVSVDINGKKLGNSKNTDNWGVFSVSGGTTLILDGEGVVSGVSADKSGYHMAASTVNSTAKLVINNGTFTNAEVDGTDEQYDLIYSEKGIIEINGGTFICKTPKWTLNCKDSNYKAGTANIIVKGGTFFEFDPSNCTSEGNGTNFVAEGYKVISETRDDGIWYTVVPAE